MRVSFDILPEEFSSSSEICCEFKRNAKVGELTNPPSILIYLLTQANKEKNHNHLDSILEDIHRALELCGTEKLANEALYESLVDVTLSLVESKDTDIPTFQYLQVLPRYSCILLHYIIHLRLVFMLQGALAYLLSHIHLPLIFDHYDSFLRRPIYIYSNLL